MTIKERFKKEFGGRSCGFRDCEADERCFHALEAEMVAFISQEVKLAEEAERERLCKEIEEILDGHSILESEVGKNPERDVLLAKIELLRRFLSQPNNSSI